MNGTFTSNAPVSRGGGEVRECDGIGGTRCGVAGDAAVLTWPPGVRNRAAGPRMREHGGGDAGGATSQGRGRPDIATKWRECGHEPIRARVPAEPDRSGRLLGRRSQGYRLVPG